MLPKINDTLKNTIFIATVIIGLLLLSGCQFFNKANAKGQATSAPVLVDGKMYVGSVDKTLYALNAVTGSQSNKYENMGIISAPLTYANGTIFAGSNDYQTLYAIDTVSKKIKWKFESGGQVISSTAYADGIVYFASDNFYAIDATTGKEKWRFEEDTAVAPPAVDNGTVYFVGYTTKLYAFDIKTGKLKFDFRSDDVTDTELGPVAADGVVYLGSDDLYALDGATGKEVWKFKVDGGVLSSPQLSEGVIYFGNDKGHIFAVDAKSGKEIWKFSTKNEVYSSPAVSEDTVYFGSNYGNFYAYNATTGKKKWQVKLTDIDKKFRNRIRERTAEEVPVVSGGLIYYVTANNGKINALDTKTGKIKWSW